MKDRQLRYAARKLCELRGINPDDSVPHGADPDSYGFVPAVLLYSPAWTRALIEIENRDDLDRAMKFGNEYKGD